MTSAVVIMSKLRLSLVGPSVTESITERFKKAISLDVVDYEPYTLSERDETDGEWGTDISDTVVLLHPESMGRASLTDVADARYNKLIPYLSKKVGKSALCIIVYDINLEPDELPLFQKQLKERQKTAFTCAETIITCRGLENMTCEQKIKILRFLNKNYERQTSNRDDTIDIMISKISKTNDGNKEKLGPDSGTKEDTYPIDTQSTPDVKQGVMTGTSTSKSSNGPYFPKWYIITGGAIIAILAMYFYKKRLWMLGKWALLM